MNELDLHNYQRTAIQHILKKPFCGLFLDMGLGKTIATLTAIKKLMFEELDVQAVLVIAPKRVAENVWTSERSGWDHTKHLKMSKIMGTEEERKKALTEKAEIYLLGRDNVTWLCKQYEGLKLPFDMLIIDESSSFKSPKALRFKALRTIQPSFKRIVLLTGTPAPNGLIDLWSQIYLLDRGQRLGKFITRYREEYFIPGQRSGAIIYNYRLQKTGEIRIHKKINDICMSMKAEDYLDMPGQIINDIKIILTPDVQEKYDAFERDQVLEIIKGDISAINAAALSNKLLQFANGAVYDENKDYHEVHNLKLEATEEIVETAAGKPVLIAWTYRHDMYRLKKRLREYDPRELKTSQDILDWNAGKIQVLLTHPASGGHGLNLQAGGNIILWFGQTWSLELYQQLNARLTRQGQKEIVIINRLIAMKTEDQNVVRTLARKDSKQEGLMQAMKARIEKYTKQHEK